MKKIITTAVLALLISTTTFAQRGGWNQPVRQDNCLPPIKIYTKQVPLRTTYVPQTVRYAQPAYQPYQYGPVAMNPGDFNQLAATINRAGFESTKFAILQQALVYNYFTSQQVLQLMNQFSFESYRLDVAKIAYNKTVDPYNYYVVNNAFSFSSSVNELGDYLAMR